MTINIKMKNHTVKSEMCTFEVMGWANNFMEKYEPMET